MGLPLVVLALGLAACTRTNPGWMLGESASEASSTGVGESTTTTSASTTTTTSETTTLDASSSTTGVEPVCPDFYCPFYTDVATEPDEATCLAGGGVEKYFAYLDKQTNEFFLCGDAQACVDGNCSGLKLKLPPEYAIFTNPLSTCNYIEHEKIFAGKCLTRSLALWNGEEDPNTAAPRMILAAHSPEAPPALTDLTVAATGESLCGCKIPTGCAANYVIPPETWCCGGEVAIRGLALTNDVGATFNFEYTGFLGAEPGIPYRGCSYDFLITQSHFDLGAGCGSPRAYQPGWFMLRGNCQ